MAMVVDRDGVAHGMSGRRLQIYLPVVDVARWCCGCAVAFGRLNAVVIVLCSLGDSVALWTDQINVDRRSMVALIVHRPLVGLIQDDDR